MKRHLTTVFALAVLSSLGAGCGDAASPADDFLGTWRYIDEQSTLTCPATDPILEPPVPNKTFSRGLDTGIVDLSPSPLDEHVFCDFVFDLAGPVATLRAGQACTLTGGDMLTIDTQGTPPVPKWTFTLNSATTAEELVNATVHITLPPVTGVGPNVNESCGWALVGHLQRVSKE
jgi:hypothetical protein